MNKTILLAILAGLLLSTAGAEQQMPERKSTVNPFYRVYRAPFECPPFDEILLEHYLPALERGMQLQKKEIDLIARAGQPATFENTIARLDNTGNLLVKVRYVLDNLKDAETGPELQKIAAEAAPLLARHQDDIWMNAALFERVRAVYEAREGLGLTPEQAMLLKNTYRRFVRGGAGLDAEKKTRLRAVNEELALLQVRFSDNVLAENNAFKLVVDRREDLAGLPPDQVDQAAQTAAASGLVGKWAFSLTNPSVMPFLTYAQNRGLREKIWRAYVNRGNNGGEHDNKQVLARIAALRAEKARLLGHASFADYELEESMARKPAAVYELMAKLWTPALARAAGELKEMQEMMGAEGGGGKIEPWDWRYYAEMVKRAKYDLDEEALRPYFSFERVLRDGVFAVAGRLFGLSFSERKDIPVYHPEVRVFEVKDRQGAHVGILYLDYFPRPSKRGGAWMNNLRDQYVFRGTRVTPIILNCGNFSPPLAGKPSLLTFDEVATLFHEFGHTLHGLLSDCTYRGLSGTRVARDFVELPSSIMENWAAAPEVMKSYARHYQTGDPIPDGLVEKIRKASLFNQGFAAVELVAASILDMDWHTLGADAAAAVEPLKFEEQSMARLGLIPEMLPRYRSTYFNHVFGGEYAAGYYSYLWSEVLDADAFSIFKEKGIFDPATAESFRANILSRGGSEEPMELFKRFAGREPRVEPLLKRRGLLPEEAK